MVMLSGTSLPVSHMTSTLSPASRSNLRLDGMRFNYPQMNGLSGTAG
jgi:hypothetical protein